MNIETEIRQVRAAFARDLRTLFDIENMIQNEAKQADSVENGPNSVEKPSKFGQVCDLFYSNQNLTDFIAIMVTEYQKSLVKHGMEPSLAGSLAKDLSGRLWGELLEDGG